MFMVETYPFHSSVLCGNGCICEVHVIKTDIVTYSTFDFVFCYVKMDMLHMWSAVI